MSKVALIARNGRLLRRKKRYILYKRLHSRRKLGWMLPICQLTEGRKRWSLLKKTCQDGRKLKLLLMSRRKKLLLFFKKRLYVDIAFLKDSLLIKALKIKEWLLLSLRSIVLSEFKSLSTTQKRII